MKHLAERSCVTYKLSVNSPSSSLTLIILWWTSRRSFFLAILIEFQQKKKANKYKSKSIISIWSSRDVGFNSDWLRKKHKIFQPIAKGRGIQKHRYCNSTRARVPLVLFGSIFSYFLYGNRILRHNEISQHVRNFSKAHRNSTVNHLKKCLYWFWTRNLLQLSPQHVLQRDCSKSWYNKP